ncbi:hypothetical protein [Variovorax sp. UMC13]|uniref:hypothetical protein n=1 Tax=Variovorax sp. UMC13 TaxID=1862326 RepID=UPI001603120C|nr:hypothetical protein [Variovorax sp. UMC13]MBB1601584.1 hypothetical protein [Variovorax sp. UMC13]
MSIVLLPVTLPVQRQDFGFMSFDLDFSNTDTGSSQVVVLGPARRTCSLVSESRLVNVAEAAAWRRLQHALPGKVNKLAVFDLQHPFPRGTARGAWTALAAPAGASTLSIQAGLAQAGKTLLTGDWIGVNQGGLDPQLLHVQSDAVVDEAGLLTVAFGFVLRRPVVAGSAVVWERPVCLMRRADSKAGWSSEGHTQGGFSLELVESWES